MQPAQQEATFFFGPAGDADMIILLMFVNIISMAAHVR